MDVISYLMEGSDNVQLRRKFQRKQTFFKEMEGISKKYFELEQQVYYSPIQINPNMIVRVENKEGKVFKREDFLVVNGQYQPKGERSFEKLILQIVQTVPRPQKPFGVIYVNTLAEGDAYNDFKKVLELLPFEYLSNMTKIYVLQPSFINKAFFWLTFGTITNYIKNKTVNVDLLSELAKQSRMDFDLLKRILPKNVVEELIKWEPKPEPVQPLKTEPEKGQQYRSGLREPGRKEQQEEVPQHLPHYHSQILGVDIEQPQKPNKKAITDYEIGPTGAPIILQLLIYFFDHKEQTLKVQGLFRKSVSIDDQTEILGELQHKNYNYLQQVTNPHIIANAMKRFLANFRQPIIPYAVFDVWMLHEGEPTFPHLVIDSVQKLGKVSKMALFLLFSFLREKVLPFAESSKMGENNLCIVFGPCLMKAEVGSIKDLLYAKKIINTTAIILRQFQAIFGDEQSRNMLRRNSYVEYRKDDIMQKLTPSKHPLEQESKVLDRTSDYVKNALKEKEEADCYLDVIEAEDAIQHPGVTPPKQMIPEKTPFIQIAPQEQSIQLPSLKQSKTALKQNEHTFTQI